MILLRIYQAEHLVMTTSGNSARLPGWVHDMLCLTDNCSCCVHSSADKALHYVVTKTGKINAWAYFNMHPETEKPVNHWRLTCPSLPSQPGERLRSMHLPSPPSLLLPWSQGENQGKIRKELGDKHISKTINTS